MCLEGLQRVIIEFDGVSKEDFSLFKLERHVKAAVEPMLHLLLRPRLDQNKLRRLNDKSVQANGYEQHE